MTMFFYLPLIEAKNYTEYAIFNDDYMATNNKFVKENTLEMNKFIERTHDDYRLPVVIIGIPIIVLLLMSIYLFNKVDKENKKLYILFWIFAIFSIFMTTKFFPWEYMPNFICKLQFPWRMLGFFGFFASFIC